MIERTLVLIKPDGVQRGLVGEIIKRFEGVGLKIVGIKMTWINEMFAEKHYSDIKERRGERVFNALMELITMGPVIAMVLEGVDAVEIVRKICGPTEPRTAPPGTIRGDYAHVSFHYSDEVNQAVRNVVHASGTKEEEKMKSLYGSYQKNYITIHQFMIYTYCTKKLNILEQWEENN